MLPSLELSCARYTFTDVSEVFLRQAEPRFARFARFMQYELLNIDADPRLQGFAAAQFDVAVATNVLHATPFMRNTLQNCTRILRSGGFLVVNEVLITGTFAQITFGMTDGWWLFSESCDPERTGQESPMLSWRQWQALLVDSGFDQSHCMQGDAFLRSLAVVVAQSTSPPNAESTAALSGGAHFITGGLGGLGLVAARLLIEDGAQQVVLSSRNDRVAPGRSSDWAWLAQCQRARVCERPSSQRLDMLNASD